MVISGLNYKLKKKFKGMDFYNLFKLVTMVTYYEKILKYTRK